MERCRHMQRNLPSAGRTVDLVEVLLAVGLVHKIDSVACTVAAEAVHHKGCNFVEEVRRKLVWVVEHHMADSLEVALWVGRRSAQLHMGHSAAEEQKSFHNLVATLHMAGSAAAVPREGRQRSLDYVMAADAHHKADFAAERPLEDRLHMN